MTDGDELGLLVGCAEGVDDGTSECVTVGELVGIDVGLLVQVPQGTLHDLGQCVIRSKTS